MLYRFFGLYESRLARHFVENVLHVVEMFGLYDSNPKSILWRFFGLYESSVEEAFAKGKQAEKNVIQGGSFPTYDGTRSWVTGWRPQGPFESLYKTKCNLHLNISSPLGHR